MMFYNVQNNQMLTLHKHVIIPVKRDQLKWMSYFKMAKSDGSELV